MERASETAAPRTRSAEGGTSAFPGLLARILESIAEGITVHDAAGRVVYVNPAGARACGYQTPEEMLRAPPGDFTRLFDIFTADGERLPADMLPGRRALRGETVEEMLIRVHPREGGADRWVSVRATGLAGEDEGDRLAINLLRDVTHSIESERANARLAAENARLFRAEHAARAAAERLQRLTESLTEATSADDVARIILEHGVAALGAWGGVLALPTEDSAALEIRASIGYSEEACMGPGRRWPMDAAMPIADATRDAAPVFVGSPEEWSRRYALGYVPRTGRSAAWAAVPIVPHAGDVGALLWTFDAPRSFDDDARSLMLSIGRVCSQALDRVRFREAEHAARAAAEEANRAKTEFLKVMSHELRTPLNAIGGYADLLENGIFGPITEGQREATRRIRVSGHHLLSLINDVLNFAKLEAGRVAIDVRDIALRGVLEQLGSLVEPQLRAKHLRFSCEECDPDLLVKADREKLRQVGVNLLSNAVKFTPPGGAVLIECHVEPDIVQLRFRDTGVGIPPDQLEQIFEPFVQLGRGLESGHEGTGLGLAISRDLARSMGGDLAAHSDVGEGSVFTLTLRRGG